MNESDKAAQAAAAATGKVALVAAVGLVGALAVAVGTGVFDGVLKGAVPPAEKPNVTEVPAKPAAPEAPAAATQVETIVPVFDIVRVEPTGDAVIAGQGTPDGEVEILSGDTVIAKGRISPTGEWAIVLSDPLKAGAHDLTIRTRGSDGNELKSEQSVAVQVPEGGSGEVLVVVNRPGAPSEVLQVPTAEAMSDAVELAGKTPAPPAEPAPAEVAAAEPAPPPSPAGAAPVAEAPAAETPATVPAAQAPAPAAPGVVAAPAAVPTPSAPAAEPAIAAPVAEAPAVPAVEAPVAEVPGAEGQAANQAPADAPPAQPPSDEVATGGETVVVANPPAEEPAVAAAQEPAPAASATPAAPVEVANTPADAPAPVDTAPAQAAPAPTVTVEAVELENGERFFAAGAAAPGAVLRVYVDDVFAGETSAMDTGRWLLDATVPLKPGPHQVRVDQVQPDGTVLARAGVPFDIAAAEIAAVVEGSGSGSVAAGTGIAGEARVGASRSMIIRKGDNLWRIARRLYGQGVRYSTIYAANTDQIGNPDMIFPGQVFVIPEGDRNWQPATAEAPPAATGVN